MKISISATHSNASGMFANLVNLLGWATLSLYGLFHRGAAQLRPFRTWAALARQAS